MRAGLAAQLSRQSKLKNWRSWTADEDELLRQLAGHVSIAEIQRELSRLPLRPHRSYSAISNHAQRNGIFLGRHATNYTMHDLEKIFTGKSSRFQHWVLLGLPMRRWNAKPKSALVVAERDLKVFLRAHPWLWDWGTMPAGYPLTSWAHVVQIRDPWLSLTELARLMDCSSLSVVRRWLRMGLIPAKRRPGACHGGMWFVRAADVSVLLEQVAAAREQYRRNRLANMQAGHAMWAAERRRLRESVAA